MILLSSLLDCGDYFPFVSCGLVLIVLFEYSLVKARTIIPQQNYRVGAGLRVFYLPEPPKANRFSGLKHHFSVNAELLTFSFSRSSVSLVTVSLVKVSPSRATLNYFRFFDEHL